MISVILPVYNGEKFLIETIESLLDQSVKDIEIIIVNDGSTDRSEELIMSFTDERIHYFKQENNGVASAFNKGLSNAQGDFITFHGADDVSLPYRFERLLQEFCCEKTGFVHSDMLLIDVNGSPFGYWQSSNISSHQIYSFFLNVGTPFNNASILFKREAIKDIFYDEDIKVGSDTDFILKASKGNWRISHISEPLYLYRRHQANVTNNHNTDVLAKHIKKNLTNDDLYTLQEVQTGNGNDYESLFAAKLIAGLALSRRWMINEAFQLFNEAIPLIKLERERTFYEGMKGLIEKDYPRAVNHFSKIANRNHLDENYLGEAFLLLKKYDQAYTHFFKAIKINPSYYSAIQNIKAVGMLKGHNLLDKQVNKYK